MRDMQSHPDVLFFSRGRGKGHAVPDLAIARELRACCPGIRIQFVSYAIGADVLRDAAEHPIDLDMPEANPMFETLLKASRLMDELRPHLVVSHEELAVLPAAAMFGLPAIFLSHWFPPSLAPLTEALQYATEVLFMERSGLFPEPREVKGRVQYVGPFTRRLEYGAEDRDRARRELRLGSDEKLILVLPGSPPEQITPTVDLIVQSFDLLPYPRKRIHWVAGKDREYIASRTVNRADITIVDTDWRVERLMVACDVAVTKGTYNIGRELTALGVRSISLSHGKNAIDDLYAKSFAANTPLYAQSMTAPALAKHMEDAVAAGPAESDAGALAGDSAAVLARHLAGAIAMPSHPL